MLGMEVYSQPNGEALATANPPTRESHRWVSIVAPSPSEIPCRKRIRSAFLVRLLVLYLVHLTILHDLKAIQADLLPVT